MLSWVLGIAVGIACLDQQPLIETTVMVPAELLNAQVHIELHAR